MMKKAKIAQKKKIVPLLMEIVSPGCKLLKTVGLSSVRLVLTKLRLKNRQN